MPVKFFSSRNTKGELELITEFGSGRTYATIVGPDKTLTLAFKDGHLFAVLGDGK